MTAEKKKESADTSEQKQNLSIWERVSKTNPSFTKQFNRGGGFKGTATNPTYLMMVATEMWGAAGKGWGYNIIDENYIQGAPVYNDKGAVLCNEVIHVVRLDFWYIEDGVKYTTPPQFGQTAFIGKNKFGIFTDEEAPKKSVTDAMTKCMSMLGFSADIFMGMYDDVKYLATVKQQFAEKKEDAPINKDTVKAIIEDTVPNPLIQNHNMNLFKADVNAIGSMDSYTLVANKYSAVMKALRAAGDARYDEMLRDMQSVKAGLQPDVIDDEIRY